ncbi:MAG TPA: hypothetical protein VGM20_12320 [Gemmatimonadales bacterium]
MTERRYSEEEAGAIFRFATEHPGPGIAQTSGLEGLTLVELQAIGREVGLPDDAVERAAHLVEVRKSAVSRRLLGLPIGVERRVKLPRRLTDGEWERLVVQLRDVFGARGTTKSEGSLRQWTNGNLYVLDEPTADGRRLRLGSLHGMAARSIKMGLAAIAGAAIVGIGGFFGLDVAPAWGFIGAGAVLIVNGVVRVPGWARLRGRQMEELAAQLTLPTEPATTEPATLSDRTAAPPATPPDPT